ncbi:MAG TPA: hypothetical protein VIM69_10555 [Opitutaceae bacterium]
MTELNSDNMGDLPFILSNSDRHIIRSMTRFLLENIEMDEVALADLVEFNNRMADQFDEHLEKTNG